jgi:uncharacterized membrane protein
MIAALQPSRAGGQLAQRPARRRRFRNVGEAERLLSLIGGGALAAFGLMRGGLAGLALGLVGGGLLYRGATGHCHLYGALGVSTADDIRQTQQEN